MCPIGMLCVLFIASTEEVDLRKALLLSSVSSKELREELLAVVLIHRLDDNERQPKKHKRFEYFEYCSRTKWHETKNVTSVGVVGAAVFIVLLLLFNDAVGVMVRMRANVTAHDEICQSLVGDGIHGVLFLKKIKNVESVKL